MTLEEIAYLENWYKRNCDTIWIIIRSLFSKTVIAEEKLCWQQTANVLQFSQGISRKSLKKKKEKHHESLSNIFA